MAIELPSKADVLANPALDERLASLEAAFFADQTLRENPALSASEPPRTPREILAWTTRRFGPALIAVTAALSVATGYLVMERSRAPVPAAAPAAIPQRHTPPAAHRRAAPRQDAPVTHHAASSVRVGFFHHGASAPLMHQAAPPVVYHAAPRLAVYRAAEVRVVRRGAHVPIRHTAPAVVPHAAPAPHAAQTASDQLAAWERTHPASQARASTTAAAEPAPQTRPRSEPAAATATAAGTTARTEPGTTTSAPSGAPDTSPNGTRTPPTNPGGIWTERLPGGGTLGGAIGPILGVPRDSCTPQGGRTGIVMQAISILSRQH